MNANVPETPSHWPIL